MAAIAQSLYSDTLDGTRLLVSLAFGLTTAARNLIGDLRDIAHDKGTFCVSFGKRASNYVAVGLKICASAIFISISGEALVAYPLLAESAMQLSSKDDYKMHKLSVLGLATTLVNFALCSAGMAQAMVATTFCYLSVLAINFFYEKVPRRSNPPS